MLVNDFKLSDSVDKEKLFMVKSSEIEGRLDPDMLLFQRKISNFQYDTSSLSEVLLCPPQYGANESGIERLDNKSPRYIRITDINIDGSLKKGLGKTASNIEEKFFLNSDDLLFARSGNTVGKTYLHSSTDYKCFFAGYMIRFIIDNKKISPKFVYIYTKTQFYKDWVHATQRTAGQPNINAQEYKSLKIPVPPKEIQQQIVDIYEKAYEGKQQKEAEAKTLLASIDDYLLNELGIELPKKDNSLSNRIFTTKFTELTENRFDPFYFLNCIKSKHSSIYKEYSLKELAYINKGQSITSSKIVKGEYPVIAGGQTSPYSHNEYNYFKNIITVSASGAYAGYVWYHDYPIFASDCNVIKSKNENKCLTIFLYNILKVKQTELYNFQQGSGQPHVYAKDIKKISIPLPPPDKQREIVSHIKQIREKAKKLENEAKEVLESTKKVVEKMILGE